MFNKYNVDPMIEDTANHVILLNSSIDPAV